MMLLQMLDVEEKVPLWGRSQQKTAFSKCVIEEILLLVWDHPWTPASESIENFVLKLELFKKASVTDEQKQVFSLLADMALEVLRDLERLESLP